jgi:signal transduction histidine kinase
MQRLYLAIEEAQRLQRLLNEILLYAKPQQLQTEVINLKQMITELAPTLCQLPVARDRQLYCDLPEDPIQVSADLDKLKQVFINLVTNAFEASPQGQTITWRVTHLANQPPQVCIAVHNVGEPIPPDLLPQLTQPFCTTKANGNGLGLAITKRIIEAHHGHLAIASSAEAGTTFSVFLPYPKLTEVEPTQPGAGLCESLL